MHFSHPDEDFELVEGPVRDLVCARGIVDFRVRDHLMSLVEARLGAHLCEGDLIRALIRQPCVEGFCEVLVVQRLPDGKPRYVGPRIAKPIAILAAALCATSIYGGLIWLAVVSSLPIFTLDVLFGTQQLHALRCYRKRARLLPANPVAQLGVLSRPQPGAPADVPLAVGLRGTAAVRPSVAAELLEFTHDAIIIWEMEGAGIVYWNRAAERLYGYSRQHAQGKVTHDLLKTQIAGGVGELEAKLARHGVWLGELRHTCSDGRIVEVEARLSLMSQEHRPWLVLEVNRDVTDRNAAEAARAEMELQLNRLRGRTPNGPH